PFVIVVYSLVLGGETSNLRPGSQLCNPPPQVPAFHCVSRQAQGPVVRLQRFFLAVKPPQQISARRMIQVVRLQIARPAELVDLLQAFFQTFTLGDRNGVIERDYWRTILTRQQAVEFSNLFPIGFCRCLRLAVKRGNCRLQLIWSGSAHAQSTLY